ncbi:SUMF1/EgtB/PvdO family nonheme iron enzyme [Mucilaginibacter sp. OK098]|uniref:SUMF1/EgtB/PvdO family nonheme iron enzyme n=1 Tax=Mucilaginibacter sp. OK098 TaxID=1855297 RepID=UPI0009226C92|nr:SUMF1/EgtB/PvdO family nonheme iron enzyme [Mucilaginibacter sp. OK098]SHN26152.1 Formylglycine-generating enzyme, required for sulfatase activity, contains SUMF1/FGE domain [Mucilaginibacter sp. OK098]
MDNSKYNCEIILNLFQFSNFKCKKLNEKLALINYLTPWGTGTSIVTFLSIHLLEDKSDENLDWHSISSELSNLFENEGHEAESYIVYVESKGYQAKLRGLNFKVLLIEELIKEIFDLDFFYKNRKSILESSLGSETKIIPICGELFADKGNKEFHVEKDALEYCFNFCLDKSSISLAVIGSFGSGKTTLLNSLCLKLLDIGLSKRRKIFPLYIDLHGKGAYNLKGIIRNKIEELYGFTISHSDISMVLNSLKKYFDIILIFDSLDEQSEVNLKLFKHISDEIRQVSNSYEFKTIIAFRGEIFEGFRDVHNLFGKDTKILSLKGFTSNIELLKNERIDALVKDAKLKSIIAGLLQKPLWNSIIHNFVKEKLSTEDTSLEKFLSYCIERWHDRELTTRRPTLSIHDHNYLTTILVLSLICNKNLSFTPDGRILRNELAEFTRKIIPSIFHQDSFFNQQFKWLQLPPDLTTESLIISSLLTTDRNGYLQYDSNIFIDFYYYTFIRTTLLDKTTFDFDKQFFLDTLEINSFTDILGVSPIPDAQTINYFFKSFLSTTNKKNDLVNKLHKILRDAFNFNSALHYNSWEELIVGNETGKITRDFEIEEERVYELNIPSSWPQINNYYLAYNIIRLLCFIDENKIYGVDFSYLTIKGVVFEDISFTRCNFNACLFGYVEFKNCHFLQCEFEYSFFYISLVDDSNSFIDCNFDGAILNTDNIGPNKLNGFINSDSKKIEEYLLDNESLIVPNLLSTESVRIAENNDFAIKALPFVVQKSPVSNKEFQEFLLKNSCFSKEMHSKEIENPYYLSLFNNSDEDLPVVYVSLIAAIAFANVKGMRLPTAIEYEYYKKIFINENLDLSDKYSDLSKLFNNNYFPCGILAEMTYQVDNYDFWNKYQAKERRTNFDSSINIIPNYKRNSRYRCEYLIMGNSYLYPNYNLKNSKLPTWVNQDQGFRCVLDYPALIHRYIIIKKSNGSSGEK